MHMYKFKCMPELKELVIMYGTFKEIPIHVGQVHAYIPVHVCITSGYAFQLTNLLLEFAFTKAQSFAEQYSVTSSAVTFLKDCFRSAVNWVTHGKGLS